jgi:histidinol-phosphatase (PHP family)
MTENEFYVSEIDRFISEAKRLDIPLEINLYGISDKRHYPRDIFWERVGKIGAKAVIGTDAHTPERVFVKGELDRALRFADKHGVEILERPTLRSILK